MNIRILAALLLLLASKSSFAANYQLTVDGDLHDLSLDEEVQIKVGDEYVSIKLEQKDIFVFSTDSFSFEHPSQHSPSKSDLGDGIFQTAVMTPLGSLLMIQEYLNLDPSSLLDFMINEITKEERQYGYKIESTEQTLTLSDGKVLQGKVVTSKYRDSDIKRFFYTYSAKDAGLFIMTQVDFSVEPDGESLIDAAVNSLNITME